jgi:YbbR domain-containing protein
VIDENERMTLCNLRAELAALTAEVATTEQKIETAKVLLSAAGIKTEQYFAEHKIAGAANNLLNIDDVEAVMPEEQKEDGQFHKICALKNQCFDQNKGVTPAQNW